LCLGIKNSFDHSITHCIFDKNISDLLHNQKEIRGHVSNFASHLFDENEGVILPLRRMARFYILKKKFNHVNKLRGHPIFLMGNNRNS
jgi:hypothetical protein